MLGDRALFVFFQRKGDQYIWPEYYLLFSWGGGGVTVFICPRRHQPNESPSPAQVCDRLGLYVVDEANIETHGMEPTPSRLARDPDWQPAHMARLQVTGEGGVTTQADILWRWLVLSTAIETISYATVLDKHYHGSPVLHVCL